MLLSLSAEKYLAAITKSAGEERPIYLKLAETD